LRCPAVNDILATNVSERFTNIKWNVQGRVSGMHFSKTIVRNGHFAASECIEFNAR